MGKVSVVLIGINGYGEHYLAETLQRTDVEIVGIVEINPSISTHFKEITKHNIPVYAAIEDFYQQHKADLAIIATPIHLHTNQAVYALEQGSNVLCEKPLSGDIADLDRWNQAALQSGKWAAIGYNWSFTDTIHRLKRDIQSGLYGSAEQLKTLVLWPRNEAYFTRSTWAGKRNGADGVKILDSVANNAAAHFIHNMLYVLGDSMNDAVSVRELEAELYRLNDIETFDTCAVRMVTEENTELLFYATHAAEKELGPQFVYKFENGVVHYDCEGDTGNITGVLNDGTIKDYGNPQANHLEKLNWCIACVHDSAKMIPCHHQTAAAHMKVIDGIHQSVPDAWKFPENEVQLTESGVRYKQGMTDDLESCFQQGCLPNELGLPWSRKGKPVMLTYV